MFDQLEGLRPAAREWAEAIDAAYDLTPTGRVLVVEAARCLDLIGGAREERASVVADGRYKGSERAHPTVTVERQARQDLLRCLAALDLKQDED